MAVYLWLCPDCDLRMYLHEKENHNCSTGHMEREAEHRARMGEKQAKAAIRLAYHRGKQAGQRTHRRNKKC